MNNDDNTSAKGDRAAVAETPLRRDVGGNMPMTDRLRRPLRDLRISVMDRCNFRCPYCMPADKFHENFQFLKKPERLSFAEITRLARLFAGEGVNKLRITGGEPLLRRDLPELISELAAIAGIEDVALTTNGVLLRQHASALKAAGLDRITVSLDTLDEDVFTLMSGGRGELMRVLDGIQAAQEAGLTPIKINAVVQRGVNDHTVLDMLEHFRGTGVVVRLIEYMDVGNINHWQHQDMVPAREILAQIQQRWPVTAAARAHYTDVASRYLYDDGQGEIGFITSVTDPFCGACSRARLSSDGKLYTCLFASDGTDIRGPLREGADDEALLSLITGVWRARTDRYSEQRASLDPSKAKKIEMFYIGG